MRLASSARWANIGAAPGEAMGACASKRPPADVGDVTLQQATVCEVLFFPDKALPCRSYLNGRALCTRPHCTFAHEQTSLVRLLEVLGKATKTLDICVFTITCNEIADAVQAAAQRGVAVRIITDDEQAKSQGSDVARLAKVSNIHVRHDGNVHSHMHHKFAIIDSSILLNGS